VGGAARTENHLTANQTGLATFKDNRSNSCRVMLAAVTINSAAFDFGITNDVIFKRVW
jgi:hypothetical protein